MKKLGGVRRRDLFDRVERQALLLLPTERFGVSEWKRATVNVDYHVQLAEHCYSVPYTLVREEVEARLTATTIEVFYKGHEVLNGPTLNKLLNLRLGSMAEAWQVQQRDVK